MAKKKNLNIVVTMDAKQVIKTMAGLSDTYVNNFVKYYKVQNDNTKEFKKLQNRTGSYWSGNIYKVFNRRKSSGLPVTGKLGRSLYIVKDGENTIFKMHRITHAGVEGESGGKDWDYGRYLRNDRGILNNPQTKSGKWNPFLDAKVHTPKQQKTRGYNEDNASDNIPMKDDKWNLIWKRRYKNNMTREFKKYVRATYKTYLKELK